MFHQQFHQRLKYLMLMTSLSAYQCLAIVIVSAKRPKMYCKEQVEQSPHVRGSTSAVISVYFCKRISVNKTLAIHWK